MAYQNPKSSSEGSGGNSDQSESGEEEDESDPDPSVRNAKANNSAKPKVNLFSNLNNAPKEEEKGDNLQKLLSMNLG